MNHQIFEPHQNLATLVKCYWSLESLNISGALVEKKDRPANTNNTIVYFVSEDCITEEARVEETGGKIIKSKMAIGEFGFVSIILDTEGNSVGLHSRK